MAAGSSSLDLVGVLVGADVVLRLGVWPVCSLLEGGAEVVALLVVLPSALPLAPPPDGEVLLLEGHGLQEFNLFQADFLEELGVPLVVLEHREAFAVHLVDLVVREIFKGDSFQHAWPVGLDGLAGGHAVALGWSRHWLRGFGGHLCRFEWIRAGLCGFE